MCFLYLRNFIRKNTFATPKPIVMKKPEPCPLQGPGSPFIDVEGLSDDDDQPKPKKDSDGGDKREDFNNLSNTNLIFFFSILELAIKIEEVEDQKVFTLAEQFIAAMPDRIKVRSNNDDSSI